MSHVIHITQTARKLILPVFDNFSLEQLNKIPEGFTNNLIWNIAHLVVTEQLLVHKLSGVSALLVSDEMIAKYRKGSKPEGDVTQQEVDEIKHLFATSLDKTLTDYNAGLFVSYQEYPTSSGYTLKNIDDALSYNLFHEGIHLGIILALKKVI
jgi:hypothetical protein